VHLGPALPSNALGSAQWLPDDAAKNCMRCGEEFTAFTRRHHCRQCGQIFCHRCCNSKALLQPGSGTAPEDRVAAHPVFGAGETDKRKPQKVCGKCFELLLPMQPFLTATNSKAMLQPDFSEATMFEWAGKPVSRSFKLEIKRAVHTLSSFLGTGYAHLPDDAWVRSLLETAHGIGLLSVYKVGFLGAVTGGGGLLLGRDVATGAWSAPCAVGAAGLSIGAQVGGELNEILLILNTREALSSLMGSTQVKLGLNLSVAMGPVGRQIEGTGVAGGKGSAACYAYAVSRGAFAGVALDGTVLFTRDRLNHNFYGHPASATQLLSGKIPPPRAAEPLYRALRSEQAGGPSAS